MKPEFDEKTEIKNNPKQPTGSPLTSLESDVSRGLPVNKENKQVTPWHTLVIAWPAHPVFPQPLVRVVDKGISS